MTDNLLEQFKRTIKSYSKEDIEIAVINYKTFLNKNTWHTHRFSLFDFLKQGN